MNCVRYLCVKHDPKRWGCKPVTRLMTSLPSLAPNEVAIRLEIELPDALFTKPSLEARVTVPDSAVTRPVVDAVVQENICAALQQQLGVELTIQVVEQESAGE